MAKEDRDKMPGVEHTYGGNEPSQSEKALNEWRKEHVAEHDIDENPTKEIHHEVRNAAGDVVEQSYTLNAPKENVSMHEIVNGVEIYLNWTGHDYEIYLPQVKLDFDNGFYDQVIRATQLGSEARKLFKKAKELAEQGMSPGDMFKVLEKFIREELKYEENDE